jgi:endonuclease/exonuclease/phosphatase family metal-dependent hydrolase
MVVRILSYNILDGGKDRVDLLSQVIELQKPDLVGLVEADDPDVVQKLAARMKMDFIHAPGNKKASALLSRFPISRTINHAPLHPQITKSLLEAVMVNGAGTEWTLGVLHLHAGATEDDEAIREREIEEVLKIFAPYHDERRPHLLMGDFNSNAPYQRIDPSRCKPSTRDAWVKNGGYLPRRVVQRILDAGYLDSLWVVDPNAAETAGTFSTEFPGQRVDYIFTFGFDPSRLHEAAIVYAPPARQASDHFPVLLEII